MFTFGEFLVLMFITVESLVLQWFFMHRKGVFAIAGVFLAIALIAPPVILITQARNDFGALIREGNNPTHQTGGNTTFMEELTGNSETVYAIVAVVEAVFVILFVVAAYIGINHYHGELDKPKNHNKANLKTV